MKPTAFSKIPLGDERKIRLTLGALRREYVQAA